MRADVVPNEWGWLPMLTAAEDELANGGGNQANDEKG